MLINSAFSYGKGFTTAGWEFPNHRPTFSRIYYILGGSAYYRDSEREFGFLQGHLYILPADRTYSLWEDKGDKLDHLYLHIITTPKVAAPIVRNPAEDPFLSDVLALLLRYVECRHSAAVYRLTEALALYVLDKGDRAGGLSLGIRTYLDEGFRSSFSAEELSRHFGYSPSYLYKAFRHDYGVSPKRYHADRRFEYAARRLTEGAGVGEIAEELLYSSLANFSRDFKKRFGISPAEYARRLPK